MDAARMVRETAILIILFIEFPLRCVSGFSSSQPSQPKNEIA